MAWAVIRDLGISLPGTPGEFNAITDVAGVEVGYSTIILGQPEDYRGPGSPPLHARALPLYYLEEGKEAPFLQGGTI